DENHPLAARVESGVVVKDVEPGSPAAQYGLRPGDIITSVNRKNIESLAEFKKVASGEGRLLLHLRRGNSAMFLLIR
ncbi:MAG: PDZ domain-containing protein, partial [Nevskiales bacterium]